MKKKEFKILIVEDESDICTSVHSCLGKRGFLISTTGSGKDALMIIKSIKPDIVLLDISLHDLNGIEVLRQLRTNDSDTKVIVVTGQMHNEDEINQIKSLGVSAYKTKPINLENLERIIYNILGEAPSLETKEVENQTTDQIHSVVHLISNSLGVIRIECENFRLNYEQGVYKNKTPDELIKMAVLVMKDVEKNIDCVITKIDQMTGYR